MPLRFACLLIIGSIAALSVQARDEDVSSCERMKDTKRRADCFESVAKKLAGSSRAEKEIGLFIASAKREATSSFIDPDSANFRQLVVTDGEGGKTLCGEVNGKNRFGGYVGYRRFISSFNNDEKKFAPARLEEMPVPQGALDREISRTKAELFNIAWEVSCINREQVWRE